MTVTDGMVAEEITEEELPSPIPEPATHEPRTADPRRENTEEVAAPRGTGFFKVNSRPWSEVWVDGARHGQTGVPSFEVSAGRHVVKLVRPDDGAEKVAEVDVPVGATVSVGCWDFERRAGCL